MIWFNNQYSGWMQFLSRLCSKTVDEIRWENVSRRLFEAAWMCLWKIRCFGWLFLGDFSVRSLWLPHIPFNMLVLVSSVRTVCLEYVLKHFTPRCEKIIGWPQPCVRKEELIATISVSCPSNQTNVYVSYRRFFVVVVVVEVAPPTCHRVGRILLSEGARE